MVFDAFALILAMLVLGYVFQRWRVLPDNAAQTLNLVVLSVCLPAAVPGDAVDGDCRRARDLAQPRAASVVGYGLLLSLLPLPLWARVG